MAIHSQKTQDEREQGDMAFVMIKMSEGHRLGSITR